MNENGLIHRRSLGERILVCWTMSLCCCFSQSSTGVLCFLPVHPTFQNLASPKGSSRRLEKALPTLPCLHSTVKEEGLRTKDSTLLLEAEQDIRVNFFLDPLKGLAIFILKDHILEMISDEPLPHFICPALLWFTPPALKLYPHNTCSRWPLGWLLRNFTCFSLIVKWLLLVWPLLVHFQASPKRDSEGGY